MSAKRTEQAAGAADARKLWEFNAVPYADAMMDLQRQLLEYTAEFNQIWATRAQSEQKLVADLIEKLAAAKSAPEAASAWQNCLQQQMQLYADDAKRYLDQHQKFMRAGADLFAGNGAMAGTGT